MKSIDDAANHGIEEILKVVYLDVSISFRKHEFHEDDIISSVLLVLLSRC